MKKLLNRVFSLALAVMLVLALSATVLADSASVTFNGKSFAFKPGSVYTETDLFENFKNVMPGDTLSGEITVSNLDTGNDYALLYMKAVAHDENNPLSENVAKTETIESVNAFLSQLTLRVYRDGETTPFYEVAPNETAQLTEYVLLGKVYSGGSLKLRVELEVPIELDNDFANALGEVDWVFLGESYNEYHPWFPVTPDDDEDLTVKKQWSGDNAKERPGSVTVTLYNGDKAVDSVVLSDRNGWTYTWEDLDSNGKWQVLETNVPKGYAPSYRVKGGTVIITNTGALIQTGQLNWPIWVLGGLGVALVLLGGVMMARKKKKNA